MDASLLDLRRTSEPADSPYLLHHVRVTEAVAVSPTYVQITVSGPELDRVATTGLDQRINLIFPLPELGLTPMAMVDDWYGAWRLRPESHRNPIRTYTVRAIRPQACEMDILFVCHGPSGPAGRWIEDVTVGDELMLCAPNSRSSSDPGGIDFDPPRGCTRFLLVGDETAAPAIASILGQLPADATGSVLVELPHPEDAAILPSHPGVEVRVFGRSGARGDDLKGEVITAATALTNGPAALTQEVEDVDVDVDILWEVPRDEDGVPLRDHEAYAWLAGEASVIKVLRRQLVTELGWDRRAVAFMGYWREGRVDND